MKPAMLEIARFEGVIPAAPLAKARPELTVVRSPPPPSSDAKMITVDRELFLALRRVLRAATKDCLRETFGVSETTWVKLRDGRPVKRVTLERLMIRYGKITRAYGLVPKAEFGKSP
jgi:hypothetical protein